MHIICCSPWQESVVMAADEKVLPTEVNVPAMGASDEVAETGISLIDAVLLVIWQRRAEREVRTVRSFTFRKLGGRPDN